MSFTPLFQSTSPPLVVTITRVASQLDNLRTRISEAKLPGLGSVSRDLSRSRHDGDCPDQCNASKASDSGAMVLTPFDDVLGPVIVELRNHVLDTLSHCALEPAKQRGQSCADCKRWLKVVSRLSEVGFKRSLAVSECRAQRQVIVSFKRVKQV